MQFNSPSNPARRISSKIMDVEEARSAVLSLLGVWIFVALAVYLSELFLQLVQLVAFII